MNDDTTQRQETPGRTIRIIVFGDNADEIELAALDKAREFFGTERQLGIVHDYNVFPASGSCFESQSGGKQYYAGVTVRTVEP